MRIMPARRAAIAKRRNILVTGGADACSHGRALVVRSKQVLNPDRQFAKPATGGVEDGVGDRW